MSDPVVRITSLSKSYGTFAAVSDVSFEVAQGEVFALLGPNGAGKTTLIRILMDITRPDSGTVEVFGRKVDGSIKARAPAEAKRLAAELLARLELSPWTKKKIADLSKGMQQKVQFMTALIGNPELLVLDEPFSGLDPVNARLFEDVIEERRKAGAT